MIREYYRRGIKYRLTWILLAVMSVIRVYVSKQEDCRQLLIVQVDAGKLKCMATT